MRRVLAVVLRSVVVIALLAGAIGVAVFAIPLAQYSDESLPEDVVSQGVAVIERESDLAQPRELALTWTARSEVRSGSDGLVTAVFALSGEPIECAAPVLEVDATPVVSYCGPRPLSGEVTATTEGRDAEEFLAFLSSIGHLVGSVAPPTARERRDAIRWWQGTVGQVIDGSVSPTDLLWLGRDPITPTVVSVTAGQTVRVGDVVVAIDERLAFASLEAIDGVVDDQDWVFGVDGSTDRFALEPDGTITDPVTLERLQRTLDQQGLLAEGLPSTATGSVRLRVPMKLMTVPATSIVVGIDGATASCELVRTHETR